MTHGGVEPNPWTYVATDYQGNQISCSIPWNTNTRALQAGGSVVRDPACVYTHVYIGKGVDGKVESSTRTFTVAAGTTVIPLTFLNNHGLNVIDDIYNLQITAGP